MALADPQSVTISGVAASLARTGSGLNAGSFQKDDGNQTLVVSHQIGKRYRRTVRFVHRKTAADPLFPANNAPYSMTVVMTVDAPLVGYTIAEQKAVIDGWLANLQAAAGANITKILGGES